MTARLKIIDLVVEGRRPSGEWSRIVNGVTVEVESAEVVALIGESGAGKTTVALSALGYSKPGTRIVRGHVYLGDTDILTLDQSHRRKIRGRRIVYVAQSASAALNPAIPLGKLVAESLIVHGVAGSSQARERALELMKLLELPNPKNMARRYPHQVSGGQQQRVMLAMAMACLPHFLVLDEPTTALDVTTQIEVLQAIKDVIRKKESGAIYVSHDLAVVSQVADRIIVMRAGNVVEEAKTPEILRNPREEYTKQLIKAVRLAPTGSRDDKQGDQGRVHVNAPVLIVKNVCASYEKYSWLHSLPEEQHILHGVELSIYSGEVVALVGESGSGKSSLARVLAGLLPPLRGEVIFQDKRLNPTVKGRSLDELRKIQIVFQSPDTALNPVQRIEKAIGGPLELYFGLKGKARRARVEELLAMVELPSEYADRYPAELSGGEKQRVALSRAFAAEPEVILCDEVLSALDTVVGAAILDLLRDLRRKLGVAYLFISHDLATVATIADWVVVLYAGRVCEQGLRERVFSPPYHPYTALLMSSVPELRCDWLEDVLRMRLAANAVPSNRIVPLEHGCAFRTRCPLYATKVCDDQVPGEKRVREDHTIYCHRDINELQKF